MGKIQLLNETITGRIAAGEVVERPASIVKELVENSVDAQATAISIHVEEGGIREIRVSDNGTGIEPEDMPLTIAKHATSKIYTLADLEAIHSMGFRGEALSSIAAVSMLTIRSRAQSHDAGMELYSRGGKVEYIREAGLPEGTSILVDNLFFNTPARLKFLKKPGAEAAAITDIVSRLILAYPEVSFRYSCNGKTLLHSPGNGDLMGAVLCVYGMEYKERLLPVDFTVNNIRVSGYIGSPNWTYKTQKAGSFYINGRYVKSAALQNAVSRSYGERLMKGNYPFYVLHIDMDRSEVDVNVHPNKLTVHFSDENAVEYAVNNAVLDGLGIFRRTPVLQIPEKKEYPAEAAEEKREPAKLGQSELQKSIEEIMNLAGNLPRPECAPKEVKDSAVSAPAPEAMQNALWEKDYAVGFLGGREKEDENAEEHQRPMETVLPPETEETPEDGQGEAPAAPLITQIVHYKILGSAFLSYIIVESGDTLYFIDQHAAHERLLYEKLLAQETERHISQRLLVGEIFHATHEERELIEENIDLIRSIGLEIRPSGEDIFTYEIQAVPQILGDVSPRMVMEDVLHSLMERPGEQDIPIRLGKIAKGACKRAIKAGQNLPEAEIERLLREIREQGIIPNCPHGRPIAVALSKADLEKGFKRRV